MKDELRTEPEDYEARQRAHYDRIGKAYEAHYSDEWSNLYRRRFIYEPHTGSVANAARQFWYRHDDLFEENEAAVDINDLMRRNAERFDFVTTRYAGGPAYLLVFNSMVFRVPLAWKGRYTPPLLWLERKLERIQGERTSCFAMVQWRKHPAGGLRTLDLRPSVPAGEVRRK